MKDRCYSKTYIIERFESKIQIDHKTGCWTWNGWRSEEGYGGFSCCYEGKSKIYPAHRLSYMIYNGDVPDELFVLHKCNNKPCVNPEHLYIGTHKDNMNDLRDAGTLSGRNNPNFGVVCSAERKKKISDGVNKWIETNPKFNPAEFTSKNWLITDPDGNEFKIKNLSKFCRENSLKLSNGLTLYISNKNWKTIKLGE
jgi:hypothetical protein